jgi:hypothetical protein
MSIVEQKNSGKKNIMLPSQFLLNIAFSNESDYYQKLSEVRFTVWKKYDLLLNNAKQLYDS